MSQYSYMRLLPHPDLRCILTERYHFLFSSNMLLTVFPFFHRYHWQEWAEGVLWEQLFSDLFYLLWKFHYTGMQLKTKRWVKTFFFELHSHLLTTTLDGGSIINPLPAVHGKCWGFIFLCPTFTEQWVYAHRETISGYIQCSCVLSLTPTLSGGRGINSHREYALMVTQVLLYKCSRNGLHYCYIIDEANAV